MTQSIFEGPSILEVYPVRSNDFLAFMFSLALVGDVYEGMRRGGCAAEMRSLFVVLINACLYVGHCVCVEFRILGIWLVLGGIVSALQLKRWPTQSRVMEFPYTNQNKVSQ